MGEFDLVRPNHTLLAAAIITAINLLPVLTSIPVFIQLLLNSSACVYIGCMFSSRVNRLPSGEVTHSAKGKDDETVTKEDALKFPISASCVLFGLYVVYKYISAKLVNILLTAQFCLITIVSSSAVIEPFLKLPSHLTRPLFHFKTPKWVKDNLEIPDISPSVASLIANAICSIPIILYFVTNKYWLLNNIFAILFSCVAIKGMNLGSFQVGFILLWLLFFYDIFWVYGTDVMVTVAKALEIPVKLLFQYQLPTGETKYSMLGLGDIVIPGVFVALCLKFDVDRAIAKKTKNINLWSLPYFNVCFVCYILGIVETYSALVIFNHAQPALLFLVPMCTLPVLIMSIIKKELPVFWNYDASGKKVDSETKQ